MRYTIILCFCSFVCHNEEDCMWERLRSIWTVPDLRNKILFTLGILLAFRLLANISVPLTQAEFAKLVDLFKPGSNDPTSQVFNLLDVFTGGVIFQSFLFCLSVFSFFTSTIFIDLFHLIFPPLQNL